MNSAATPSGIAIRDQMRHQAKRPRQEPRPEQLRYWGSTGVHVIRKAHPTGATIEVGPTTISQGEDSFCFDFFLKILNVLLTKVFSCFKIFFKKVF
jgi:hypothetical protein